MYGSSPFNRADWIKLIRPDGVAVITGAAVYIGNAIARRVAGAGMRVVLFDRDKPALDSAVNALLNEFPNLRALTIVQAPKLCSIRPMSVRAFSIGTSFGLLWPKAGKGLDSQLTALSVAEQPYGCIQ